MQKNWSRRALLGAGAAMAAGPAWAQGAPLRVIVPFPPGGGGDTLARLALNAAQARLGQAVVVENRPGAGGNVGAELAARAAPDGATLFYGTNGTHAINEALYPRLNFRPHEDFIPVAPLSRIVLVVLVKRDLPVETLPQLIAHLRANPGRASYGSAGNGTTSHIATEMFRAAAGVELLHVPYRGNAAAMTDLIAGRIDLAIDLIPAAGAAMRSDTVRTLAVTSAAPLAALPGVPTVAATLPGFEVSAWGGIFAPTGTPAALVARLNAAFVGAMQEEAVVAALRARGAVPAPAMSPAEFAHFIAAERVKWAAAVRASGATLD